MSTRDSHDYAAALDAADPLNPVRERFCLTERLYLCGHSLGLQPKATKKYVEEELSAWADLAVQAHFRPGQPWIGFADRLRGPMANIVGARPGEVVLMNSLTVNLHLMMATFYRPTRTRYRVLIEAQAFPSDRYAIECQVRWHGFDPCNAVLAVSPRPGEPTVRIDDLEDVIRKEGDSVALVLLGGVQYYTGQLFDMERITAAGHERGCVVGFDLAHAAGNVPLSLHDWHVDFAVWCTYKYLNSGPGGAGGCFIHADHWNADLPRLAGWWGHRPETRFAMPALFDAAEGADGWQVSNPPILQLAALRASLEIFEEVGMQAIRSKSIALLEYFDYLVRDLRGTDFQVITPSEMTCRGAQVSISVGGRGEALFAALRDHNVVCDARGSVIRVSFAPLYNGFTDVYRFGRAVRAFTP